MKKVLKKSLVLGLALVCVLNIVSVIASAASPSSGDLGKNLKWSVSGKGVLTIKGKGEMADFGIADARPWDDHRDEIVKVVVEDGVTSISEEAFSHLGNLNDVEFPNTLVFVGSDIFYNSSYQAKADKYGVRYEDGILLEASEELKGTYTIANGTRVIAEYAFNNFEDQSGLKKVILNEGLITIGMNAFRNCQSIEHITIPASVRNFGEGAFDGCESLKTVVIKNGVTCINRVAFINCYSLELIAIPESVTNIDDQAFANCDKLKEVYYTGTLEQWNKMEKAYGNEALAKATVYCKGDISKDGKTNSSDALMVLQHSVKKIELTSWQIILADVYADSKINSSDALEILKISVGSTK